MTTNGLKFIKFALSLLKPNKTPQNKQTRNIDINGF